MSKSKHSAILNDIAAALVLTPGDPVQLFQQAAVGVGNAMLRKGYGTDYVIEQLRHLGARYDELRDRVNEQPETSWIN